MSPPSSPEALYHAIPQALSDEGDENTVRDIELNGEEECGPAFGPPQALIVDPRITWIYFLLGCCVLLPWNVIITAIPFFLSRLAHSSLKATFPSYLTTSFTTAGFVFLAHATATSRRTSPSRQTHATLLMIAFLTALLSLSTFFPFTGGFFFAFVVLNGTLQSTAGAYLQTSVVGVASLFGPQAVQAMMSGQAAVAVVVSGVQVISAAVFLWRESSKSKSAELFEIAIASAEERSASTFFALSTVFLILCAVAHGWLVRSPIYKTVAAPLELHKTTRDANQTLTSVGRTELSDIAHILQVAKANIIYELAIAYVFVVTIAVFPPITNSIKPTNPNIHPLLFTAIHFLVFAIGDFSGRYLCSFPRFWVWSANRLLTLSLSRTLFITLFLMCNVQRPSSSTHAPTINSDILFMLILLAFGVSNGYVTSMCMMSAASLEHNPRLKGRKEDVDVAATVATFCLIGGITLGSFASFAVRAAVCECNPFVT